MSTDFAKQLLHYSEHGVVSRKKYQHFGNYYALNGGSEPCLEKATRPHNFLSALPTEPIQIPFAISDHSCSESYCKTLGEIASQHGLGDDEKYISNAQGESTDSNFFPKNSQQQRSSTDSVDSVD